MKSSVATLFRFGDVVLEWKDRCSPKKTDLTAHGPSLIWAEWTILLLTWHTAAGRPRLQSMLLVRAIPLQAILDSAGPATIGEVSALVPLSITLVLFLLSL